MFTFPSHTPILIHSCIVKFHFCQLSSSHFTVCNLTLFSQCSLNTHAFALVDNALCQKLSEADSSLNIDRGKLGSELMLDIPLSSTHHKHADFNHEVKVHFLFLVSFFLQFQIQPNICMNEWAL